MAQPPGATLGSGSTTRFNPERVAQTVMEPFQGSKFFPNHQPRRRSSCPGLWNLTASRLRSSSVIGTKMAPSSTPVYPHLEFSFSSPHSVCRNTRTTNGLWAVKSRRNRRPCSAESARGFCFAQKHGKSYGPKAQPFTPRRTEPWYVAHTACYIAQCLARSAQRARVCLSPVPGGFKMNSWPVGPNVTANQQGS